ncbi:GNAT family N-acetyltransferase [Paenibacillus sonchi]|uniref:GNAT family N-acetyltransferase n=1 Tax=Paenibacillus sonchi TaxID=373687 RepID=UPI001FD86165|nr:GNAT family N-acetyltransferase [Paenibacillus sonchi]
MLETSRLLLRRYKQEDAEFIFQVVSQRKIAETTIMIPHPYPRQTVDWWINYVDGNFDEGKAYELGLFRKDSPNNYVGNCGLISVSKEHNNGELGFFIHPEYWNTGLATEACQALIDFGFMNLGLERIHGRCMSKNIGSKRVMEKSGLVVEGLARNEVLKWGKYEDVCHLGIIRSEWLNSKS